VGTASERRDADWFTAVYTDHHADVVRYGMRRLGDLDASSELAQDVFVVAWRRRGDVPDHSLPWLYGVARRLLANHWRARRLAPSAHLVTDAEQLQHATDMNPEAVAAAVDLRAALARLSTADQEILRLIAWERLTIAEVAVALNCNRTAAKVRLHRARRRLSQALSTPDSLAAPRQALTGRERKSQHES
jgi:RNA polymerase sigma factor (sigma-70 family)